MTEAAQHKRELGRWGEKRAKRYLKRQGYRALADNYKTERGEIDLIMEERETLVFVEVKTREGEDYTPTETAVNYGKQKRMSAAARQFIHSQGAYDKPCRFDVVVVIVDDQNKPIIRHQKSAFSLR